jgi:hypothetical protein
MADQQNNFISKFVPKSHFLLQTRRRLVNRQSRHSARLLNRNSASKAVLVLSESFMWSAREFTLTTDGRLTKNQNIGHTAFAHRTSAFIQIFSILNRLANFGLQINYNK